MFPILNPLPPPTSNQPSGSSQCTSPKLPVSCIEPGLAIHFLYDIVHLLTAFSQIIPPHSLSHRVQKAVLYICVSFAILHTGSHYHLSKFHIYVLLLLSCFSRVQLCATPETEAHQDPPFLGFSMQEHWSGLPFPSPMHESEK